ncbi:MAG TPA: hypothetical protein EYN54_10350 [Methylococcaceae bacterium]|nr:hypothetical protein [Methylococcaceae bacterium]
MQGGIILTSSGNGGTNFCNNSYLLYKNILKTQTSSVTPTESTESAGVTALYDGNSNLKFFCSSSGTVDFEFTFPLATEINSMACAGVNMLNAGVTWEFYTWDSTSSAYVKQSEGSGKKNNSPVFNAFDSVTTNKVRFRFITSSPLSVGELGCGLALRFPVPPSIGYQPSRWNTNNQVNVGQTENNTTSSSTVLKRGSTESVKFDKLDASWLDNNFIDVLDYEGLPVWFSGDQKTNPNKVIFGNWESSSKPSYESAFRSSLSFKFNGAV